MTLGKARITLAVIFVLGFVATIIPLGIVDSQRSGFDFVGLGGKVLFVYLTPLSIIVAFNKQPAETSSVSQSAFWICIVLSLVWASGAIWRTWSFELAVSYQLAHVDINAPVTTEQVRSFFDDFLQKGTFVVTGLLSFIFGSASKGNPAVQ